MQLSLVPTSNAEPMVCAAKLRTWALQTGLCGRGGADSGCDDAYKRSVEGYLELGWQSLCLTVILA